MIVVKNDKELVSLSSTHLKWVNEQDGRFIESGNFSDAINTNLVIIAIIESVEELNSEIKFSENHIVSSFTELLSKGDKSKNVDYLNLLVKLDEIGNIVSVYIPTDIWAIIKACEGY